MSAALVAKWSKAVGKRVLLDGVGFGTLEFFGPTTEGENQCGVALEEQLGEGDGYGYFECTDGHCFFTTMDTLTRVDKDGKPLKKKKAGTPAKKKFESPPSLRKKIGGSKSTKASPRSSPATLRKTKVGSKPATSSSLRNGGKGKPAAGRSTSGAKGNGRTKSHTSPPIPDDDASRINRPIARKKSTAPAEGAAPSVASEAGDGEGGDRPAFNAPDDWMEKIKEQEKEKADAIVREKEAADIAAQEARLAAAQKKQDDDEAAFNVRAEAKAAEAAAAKEERSQRREQEMAEREQRREDAKRMAMAEIAEAEEANARSQAELEQRTKDLQEKRRAQKARIAMLMSKVKMKPDSASA